MKLSFTIAKKRTDYDPKMGKLNMNQFYSLRVPAPCIENISKLLCELT